VNTPPTPPPGPGSAFGPYRIESVVAVGSMGVVYLATDERLGRRVALKTVLGHLARSASFVERFQREAAALAQLQSPHVIQVFDHGVVGGTPFIATQYAAGGDLGRLIAARGPLPSYLAVEVCAQVADALADAHRAGVVHRDVKPANVLLRDDRLDRPHVLLADFGVARAEGDGQGLTEPGSVPGTWGYLAPERIDGDPGSPASDLYAVGCLLHEALTGRPPYEGPDVEVAMAHHQAPVPRLPGDDRFTDEANRVLAGTLAKDPAQRYPSAAALRDDLRELAGEATRTRTNPAAAVHEEATRAAVRPPLPPPPAAAVPPPPPPPLSAPTAPASSRRRRWPVLAAVAAVLAIVAGFVVAVTLFRDDDPDGPVDPGPTPAAEPAVQGDLDGDGYGDVGVLSFDGLVLLRSDGTAFSSGDDDVRRRVQGIIALEGDVDDDGDNEVVRIEGDPPEMTASLAAAGSPVSPIRTPESTDLPEALDIAMTLGDVDGDGFLDLVATTLLAPDVGQVDVALGDGTGAFAPTEPWYTGPLTAGSVLAVDADGDGLDDIVHVTAPSEDFLDPTRTATLLRSDGSALTIAGQPTPVDFGGVGRRGGGGVQGVRVADLDGDGADEVLAVTFAGPLITTWSWNGTTFDQVPWYDDTDSTRPANIFESAVSDVNGDGAADVVLVTGTGTGKQVVLGACLGEVGGDGCEIDRDFEIPFPDVVGYNVLGGSTGTAR
jgi:hypothetical protein